MSACPERCLAIEAIAAHPTYKPLTNKHLKQTGIIDLEQDKIAVTQLAARFNKNPSELFQQIDSAQKSYRQALFNQLKKEYPVLAEFDALSKQRSKMKGFKAEQLDKLLVAKGAEIIRNKKLYSQLERKLPTITRVLSLKAKSHQLCIDKE